MNGAKKVMHIRGQVSKDLARLRAVSSYYFFVCVKVKCDKARRASGEAANKGGARAKKK